MNKRTRFITHAAIIAASYVVLTSLTWEFSSLAIQVRVAEALCVFVYFTPAAVPGLFIGCLLSNMISGTFIDVIFGSLATLIASLITLTVPKKMRYLYPLPTVLVNACIIPFVLFFGYGITSIGNATAKISVIGLLSLSVLIGEAIACYAIGIPFMNMLKKIWKNNI